MECLRILSVIDCHWVRVIVGGIPHIPGSTLQDKRKYLEHHLDYIRTSLVYEPRGSYGKIACIITPPTSDRAHLGLITMGRGGYYNICGSAIISAGFVAYTTGMLPAEGNISHSVFETPAGLVPIRVTMEQRKVREVSFRNVLSFVTSSNQALQFKGLKIPFSIVHSGNNFCIVDAKDIGIDVVPENTDRLVSMGHDILRLVNDASQQSESEKGPAADIIQISQLLDSKERTYRNINVTLRGAVDLSPCGTGTCAKIALFYSKGELSLGETIINQGLNGEQFKGRLVETKEAGPYQGVVPEVSGVSYITGMHYLLIDPDDPHKYGIFHDLPK